MKKDNPFDPTEYTGSTKLLAEKLEPRLRAGAQTFQQMRIVVAALVPLVVAAFGIGVISMVYAKKSDVLEQGESEVARHTALEMRTAKIEAELAADTASTSKALDAINVHLSHMDDVLLDVRLKMGAAPVATEPKRQPGRGR